jgi:hypothetical protein
MVRLFNYFGTHFKVADGSACFSSSFLSISIEFRHTQTEENRRKIFINYQTTINHPTRNVLANFSRPIFDASDYAKSEFLSSETENFPDPMFGAE